MQIVVMSGADLIFTSTATVTLPGELAAARSIAVIMLGWPFA